MQHVGVRCFGIGGEVTPIRQAEEVGMDGRMTRSYREKTAKWNTAIACGSGGGEQSESIAWRYSKGHLWYLCSPMCQHWGLKCGTSSGWNETLLILMKKTGALKECVRCDFFFFTSWWDIEACSHGDLSVDRKLISCLITLSVRVVLG